MDHLHFRELQKELKAIGLDLPMVEMIDCGARGRDITCTRSGRQWLIRAPDQLRQNVASISTELSDVFGCLVSIPGIGYSVANYDDGVVILEVKRVIDWTTLNHFESSL